MFKECKTLSELNAARVKATMTHDIIDVNSEYNKRREEILRVSSYKKVLTTKLQAQNFTLISHLPYLGSSERPGFIEWTPTGFKA